MNVEDAVRQHIQDSIHMSLGTCFNNKPWVCEVHFAYDDDLNLYFRSKPSTRHCLEIAKNSSVSGNIVKQHSLEDDAVGVYYEGRAELLMNVTTEDIAYKSMITHNIAGPDSIEEAKDPEGHQFYKIAVSCWYIFGKFDTAASQKYELTWS